MTNTMDAMTAMALMDVISAHNGTGEVVALSALVFGDVSVEPFMGEYVVNVNAEESSTHKMIENEADAMAYAKAIARRTGSRLVVFATDTGDYNIDPETVFGAVVSV